MRCQLCDGPVVGGRCKSCGMPYKNDAVLYHVNEDRKLMTDMRQKKPERSFGKDWLRQKR